MTSRAGGKKKQWLPGTRGKKRQWLCRDGLRRGSHCAGMGWGEAVTAGMGWQGVVIMQGRGEKGVVTVQDGVRRGNHWRDGVRRDSHYAEVGWEEVVTVQGRSEERQSLQGWGEKRQWKQGSGLWFGWFCFYMPRSHYVFQVGLKLMILLPHPLKCWPEAVHRVVF